MNGYEVKIAETSFGELRGKDKIKFKDTTDAIKLDDMVTPNEPIVIKPVGYVVLDIHNEKSDNVDYKNYMIIDENGNKYVTGSESLWTTFIDMFSDMVGEEEEWELKIYKVESKNYKGKYFLTCAII